MYNKCCCYAVLQCCGLLGLLSLLSLLGPSEIGLAFHGINLLGY